MSREPIDSDPGGVIAGGRDLNRVAADFRGAAGPLQAPGVTLLPEAMEAFTKAMSTLADAVGGSAGWGHFCDEVGDAAKTTGHIVIWADESSRTPIKQWPR